MVKLSATCLHPFVSSPMTEPRRSVRSLHEVLACKADQSYMCENQKFPLANLYISVDQSLTCTTSEAESSEQALV